MSEKQVFQDAKNKACGSMLDALTRIGGVFTLDYILLTHQRDGVLGADGGERLLHDGEQRLVAVRRLLAALEQQPVGGAQRQCCHLEHGVGGSNYLLIHLT